MAEVSVYTTRVARVLYDVFYFSIQRSWYFVIRARIASDGNICDVSLVKQSIPFQFAYASLLNLKLAECFDVVECTVLRLHAKAGVCNPACKRRNMDEVCQVSGNS